jgi:hypothetical protein
LEDYILSVIALSALSGSRLIINRSRDRVEIEEPPLRRDGREAIQFYTRQDMGACCGEKRPEVSDKVCTTMLLCPETYEYNDLPPDERHEHAASNSLNHRYLVCSFSSPVSLSLRPRYPAPADCILRTLRVSAR